MLGTDSVCNDCPTRLTAWHADQIITNTYCNNWIYLLMKLSHLIVVLSLTFLSTACSNWIYRIDIPQGNFLDEQDVKKLRIGMTKEQVEFVLGRPILKDAFDKDTWYYYYEMKRGMEKRGEDFEKSLVITFNDDRVETVDSDFELSEDFNTPLEQ